MGNRAVITTNENKPDNEKLGVYVHWNGGLNSVEAFLTYCKMSQFRNPINDNYGWARLCQVIGNFFGGGLSVGIDTLNNLDCDNGDNGMYIMDENWNIVDRKYFDGPEQEDYLLKEMLMEIDESMPDKSKLGEEFIVQWLETRVS